MKDQFIYKPLKDEQFKNTPSIDLNEQFKNAKDELGLQQSKRDQIITIYLAIFSFLIPFALSLESVPFYVKGLIFIAVGVIGILFSFIIVRYRVYKEIYWLCCQSLTNLMNVNESELNKETVQAVFYHCLHKKGKSYIVEGKNGKTFNKFKYFIKNVFSSETLHYLIVCFVTAIIIGLGTTLALPFELWISALIGVAVGIIFFSILLAVYFNKCLEVYKVLCDNSNASFNGAFSKAWFLHFYKN